MISSYVWDTGQGCFEDKFLVDEWKSMHNIIPVVVYLGSKIFFIAVGGSTDQIDALRLNPMDSDMLIDKMINLVFVLNFRESSLWKSEQTSMDDSDDMF